MYDNDQQYGWKSYNNQEYNNQENRSQPYNEPQFDQGPAFREEPPKKKGGILKKAALITAGAVLFGIVSGGVMAGIQVAASRYLNVYTLANSAGPDNGSQAALLPESGQAGDIQNGVDGQNGGDGQSYQNPGTAAGDVSDIVEAAMPTVVAITSTTVYQSNNYGYGWLFGGPQTYEIPSSGSGIIVGENDTELLIVTNYHLVEGVSSMKVSFIDDEVVDAVVKGTDPETDLAVISIPLDQIKADTMSKIAIARLGSSDDLKVGQGVVAIGNALGYGQSVTVGYVSALDREVMVAGNTTRTLLQTDAAINPGNSGGALLNMKGEVVGINAAKYSSTEVEGIGYAIPISKAENIMNQLMNRKTRRPVEAAKRGYLGIQGTTVDDEASSLFGMPKGVYVYKVLSNGAAADSDLREKDIITKVDGQPVKTMTALQELLTCYELGGKIDLTVQTQENGQYKEHTVQVVLGALPQGEESSVPR